jgi:hypothetical protein
MTAAPKSQLDNGEQGNPSLKRGRGDFSRPLDGEAEASPTQRPRISEALRNRTGTDMGLTVSVWTFWHGSNNSCLILCSTLLENFYKLRKDY